MIHPRLHTARSCSQMLLVAGLALTWSAASAALETASAAAPELATATATTPSVDPALEELLDAWSRALGGREALATPLVVEQRLVGEAFGLDATVDRWVHRDGRARVAVDLGGLYTFLMVHDGDQAWQVDQNGKLSQMEGADLRDFVTESQVARWNFLHRRAGVEFERLPGEDGTIRAMVTPEGGEPATFVLDPDTHLPLAWENPEQERTEIATIEGWTTHEGVLFPAAWSETRGDPQYDAHFELRHVVFHQEADPEWFAKPQEKADDVVFTAPSPTGDLPIELNTFHVFLQASINGSEPLWWVVDTGASITVINRSSAERLGLDLQGSIEGRGAGEGTTEVNLIGDVDFELPGVELRGQTIAAIDLDRIEALMGRPLDGILGYDFLSRFVVELDYERRRLQLHDRHDWTHEGDGTVIGLEFEGSQPHVRARLRPFGHEPVEGRFLIDTGANASVIVSRPFTDEQDLLSTLPDSYVSRGGFGVGGRSTSVVGRLAALELGPLAFRDPAVSFARDEKGAHADPNVAGLIGGHVLARATVLFDYERARMILVPNERFDDPFPVDALGLVFTTAGREDFHRFTVLDTIEGSPAEQAGLREGDHIVEIDGRPAAEWTVHEIWKLARGLERDLPMVVVRDGEHRAITVHCRPML